jgi:hypothetical protein
VKHQSTNNRNELWQPCLKSSVPALRGYEGLAARLSRHAPSDALHERQGGDPLAKKAVKTADVLPMLKSVEQMSHISGIGENKLRELMDRGELDYIQNGNRRLIADAAIWKWYERAKITGAVAMGGGRP